MLDGVYQRTHQPCQNKAVQNRHADVQQILCQCRIPRFPAALRTEQTRDGEEQDLRILRRDGVHHHRPGAQCIGLRKNAARLDQAEDAPFSPELAALDLHAAPADKAELRNDAACAQDIFAAPEALPLKRAARICESSSGVMPRKTGCEKISIEKSSLRCYSN